MIRVKHICTPFKRRNKFGNGRKLDHSPHILPLGRTPASASKPSRTSQLRGKPVTFENPAS